MRFQKKMLRIFFFFHGINYIKDIINVKNAIYDPSKHGLWVILFPQKYDKHVLHVSASISVSSPVPVLRHFPLTGCFSAFRPVVPHLHKAWQCFPAGF